MSPRPSVRSCAPEEQVHPMKWFLKLKEPEEGVERWREVLETIEEKVVEDGGEFYLSFPELDEEEDGCRADEYAFAYLSKINHALRFTGHEGDELERLGLFKADPDGKKRGCIVLGAFTLYGGAQPGPTSTRWIESSVREHRVRNRRLFVEMALSDEIVADLLELSKYEFTPTNMYDILEGILKRDLGSSSWNKGMKKAEDLGIAKKEELENLKRCLQHRRTSGIGARHYFGGEQPPEQEKVLSLRGMQDQTASLMRKWLIHKLTAFRKASE